MNLNSEMTSQNKYLFEDILKSKKENPRVAKHPF